MRINRLKNRGNRLRRGGTAAVEAALVMPLLIIVTFGAIDVAQYINLSQIVSNASREGARIASRHGTSNVDEVEDGVVDYLASTMPHLSESELGEAVTVIVRKAPNDTEITDGNMSNVDSGDPISVQIDFNFEAVRWLSGPDYWNHNLQTSKTICRRE